MSKAYWKIEMVEDFDLIKPFSEKLTFAETLTFSYENTRKDDPFIKQLELELEGTNSTFHDIEYEAIKIKNPIDPEKEIELKGMRVESTYYHSNADKSIMLIITMQNKDYINNLFFWKKSEVDYGDYFVLTKSNEDEEYFISIFKSQDGFEKRYEMTQENND